MTPLVQVGRFQPEYLGKFALYEALDCDIKRPHENPAIGLLPCTCKDDEVVECSLSRTTSPALIAKYQTQPNDNALPRAKGNEFWLVGQGEEDT